MHAYCCLDGYAIEDSLDERYFQESATLDLVQCRRYVTTTIPVQVVTPAGGRTKVLVIAETTRMAPPIVVEHDAFSVVWRPQEMDQFVGATPKFNNDVVEESLVAKSFGLGGTSFEEGAAISSPGNTAINSDAPAAVGSGSRGISSGAKIGIGVGAAVGVIAIILGVFLFLLGRRGKSPPKDMPYGIERDGVNQMGGIDDSPTGIGGISGSKY